MELKEALGKIYKEAKEKFELQTTPKLHLKQDEENAENPLGKTAHYDPQNFKIGLYTDGRHIKDILRSFPRPS